MQLEDTEGKHHDDDNCGKCGLRSEYHFHKMKNNVDLKGSTFPLRDGFPN